MPTYRYTGDEPRVPAPPLQGDLIPGETVTSSEPVDHPDLHPADDQTRAATEQLRAEREAATTVVDENDLPDSAIKAMRDEAEPVDLAEQPSPRRRGARAAAAKE